MGLFDRWEVVASGDLETIESGVAAAQGYFQPGDSGELWIHWNPSIGWLVSFLESIGVDVAGVGGYTSDNTTVIPFAIPAEGAAAGISASVIWGPLLAFIGTLVLKIVPWIGGVFALKQAADWELPKRIPSQFGQGLMEQPILIGLIVFGAIILTRKEK